MLIDIREEKNRLRALHRGLREALPSGEKERRDEEILRRLLQTEVFAQASGLWIYMAKPPVEVATDVLLQEAWKSGLTTAAPRCIPGTREMCFYTIASPEDLETGSFGVREPIPQRCSPAKADPNSLCIVPGLCFDRSGYRLGYGKGYYDRFLAQFPGRTIGLCYEDDLLRFLPHGRFDRTVEWIITEKSTYTAQKRSEKSRF